MPRQDPELALEVEQAHRIACHEHSRTYIDPLTGLDQFTRWYLLDRGYCCLQGCRHCPYEEGPGVNVRYNNKNPN